MIKLSFINVNNELDKNEYSFESGDYILSFRSDEFLNSFEIKNRIKEDNLITPFNFIPNLYKDLLEKIKQNKYKLIININDNQILTIENINSIEYIISSEDFQENSFIFESCTFFNLMR